MSTRALEAMVSGLPWTIRDQVLGYAHSVEFALPSICRDAHVTATPHLASQLILIAGVRKLHDIVASNYWAMDNSGKLLAQYNITRIRAGSADLSRGGVLHKQLQRLLLDLDLALSQHGVAYLLDLDYSSIARELSRK